MDLIFATNNLHKLKEIRDVTKNSICILGLSDAGFNGEIPEDFPTLEQNASQKAWFISKRLLKNCFADDTGLEVEALNGDPGVYSARYSRMGTPRYPDMEIAEGNIRKLLELLSEQSNRNARFRTIISLVLNGVEYQFEGTVSGKISTEKKGIKGFGYDPVFIPEGERLSFAEMDLARKNLISHRARAMNKLVAFINTI